MERMQLMWCCGPGKTGCCVCCGTASSNKWFPVQLVIYKWVTDPIFDIMVTLLIFINTLFLALDYHNMPTILKEILGWGNQVSPQPLPALWRHLVSCIDVRILYIMISENNCFFFFNQIIVVIQWVFWSSLLTNLYKKSKKLLKMLQMNIYLIYHCYCIW